MPSVNAPPREDGSPGALGDPARLAAVERLSAAAVDAEGLDGLTRLAALLLEAPRAQVSLTGDDQVVVSAYGDLAGRSPERGPRGESLCTVTVAEAAPLVVPDAAGDPRVSGLPPVTSGAVGAYLGVPLRASSGALLGALCAYDETPRPWTDRHVDVLTELAASVVAELELQALSREAAATAARLDLALDAADIGSFDLEVDTGVLLWDDRLVRLFGYDRASFREHLDSFNDRVHPEDLERVGAAIATAVDSSGDFSAEYRIVRPGGEVRWVEARGRVLVERGRGAGRRLLGVAYDTTELREARDRVVRVLETMNDAFYALDAGWRFTYVNREAERLLGRRREELLGAVLWEQFPETLDGPFREQYEHAALSGQPVVFEAPTGPDGAWYALNAWPGPEGLSVYFREITGARLAEKERERADAERRQAVVERERAYAEAAAANTRLALLADASRRLAESLEPSQVLERLSDLVVPDLGSWVVVAMTGETYAQLRGTTTADPERVHVVHVAHEHPEELDALRDLVRAMPLSTADPIGVGAVARTGTAEWLPSVPQEAVDALLDGADLDEAQRVAARSGDPSSALTVPLASRGRVLGAMTVGQPSGGPVDRSLLEDLAGRAGVALDNALLYGAERRTGITLQRSLLPGRLPDLPGLRAAARYLPGTTGAFVGGDWYQGVAVGPGLVVAMGDVMGHGMRSAARMGQLRAIVATLALEGHGPADLLTRLAASVDVLLDLELATLLVAAYDPDAATLTVASAGHPPPLLAPRDGEPAFVEVDPGPPLGSFAARYTERTVDLTPGDTLVLYTDGLVENRAEPLDDGLERLRVALRGLRLSPDAVCDSVLAALGRSQGGDDDVALLVLSHRAEDGA